MGAPSPVLPERTDSRALALNLASSSFVVAIASVCAIVVTRGWAWSEYLFAWDSVNFALAIHDIDVEAHQPHPPGYLGVVLLARAFVGIGSENHALLMVMSAASMCTAWLSWRLSRVMTGSLAAAWTTWAVVTFSPLHWFYGVVAEVYAAELAAGCGPRWDYLARPATRSAARDPLRPVARSALRGSRCRRRPCVLISEVLVL